MVDATAKKLLALLEPGHASEVRCAAVRVLGEVGNADAKIGAELSSLLDDADRPVRRLAIDAVGKLQVQGALPRLLELVRKGGEEAPPAAHAAARLGAKGARGLQNLLAQVSPGQRPYIAAALGGAGTTRAESAAVEFLRDREAGVVDAAVRSLIAQVPSFSAAHRRALTDHLLDLLKDKKSPLPPSSVTAALRLLAALGEERVIDVFWERIGPSYPAEVRALALQALGKMVSSPSKEQYGRLFACAADSEFRVAGPALLILQHLPLGERNRKDWLNLLGAPDLASRRLALEKLKEKDSADVAEALLDNLDHSDAGFRGEVLACLGTMDHGRKALTRALLDADTPDEAWTLARALTAHGEVDRLREDLYRQLGDYLENGDRRADAFLFLLRNRDPKGLGERLEQRALAARKKKAYDTALVYLKLLTRDPAAGFPLRYELASCGLKISPKDVAADARAQDPCLHQFELLCQGFEAELVKSLEKTKWLEPDDLYYLGFHLAEKEGRAKKVAALVLKLLVQRWPRSKLAQAAKTKLRGAGL